MATRWHLEHADGRRWTHNELNEYVWHLYEGGHRTEPPTNVYAGACIDEQGYPILLHAWGDWYAPPRGADMAVVWDG